MLAFCVGAFFVVVSCFFSLSGISESPNNIFFFYDFTIFSRSSFLNVYSPLGSGKLRINILCSQVFLKTSMKPGKYH